MPALTNTQTHTHGGGGGGNLLPQVHVLVYTRSRDSGKHTRGTLLLRSGTHALRKLNFRQRGHWLFSSGRNEHGQPFWRCRVSGPSQTRCYGASRSRPESGHRVSDLSLSLSAIFFTPLYFCIYKVRAFPIYIIRELAKSSEGGMGTRTISRTFSSFDFQFCFWPYKPRKSRCSRG